MAKIPIIVIGLRECPHCLQAGWYRGAPLMPAPDWLHIFAVHFFPALLSTNGRIAMCNGVVVF